MPQQSHRVFILVMDGVGVGELPDAAAYGDTGSATLPNLAMAAGGLHLPTLEALGLGRIVPISGVRPVEQPNASFGKMAEQSPGKDSTSGHWELTGCVLDQPFPTYPNGFPLEVMSSFERVAGAPAIGNRAASGTVIIEQLGEEHLRTGRLIVYTSADSVFQIAAHKDVIPVEELYRICAEMRRLLTGEHAVGRVIARPFVGSPGSFVRTRARRDFSLPPPHATILDLAMKAGLQTTAVGKVRDIFAGRGIETAVAAKTNRETMTELVGLAERQTSGLAMATLVDFDMLWGHRNDIGGFVRGLTEFDTDLLTLARALREGDVLFVTADHGNDPTTSSTDHAREYVPILALRGTRRRGNNLGTRDTFADVAATAAEHLQIEPTGVGTSFLDLLPG
jgi:phosphopentomutase